MASVRKILNLTCSGYSYTAMLGSYIFCVTLLLGVPLFNSLSLWVSRNAVSGGTDTGPGPDRPGRVVKETAGIEHSRPAQI
jgi:hypothetical protein